MTSVSATLWGLGIGAFLDVNEGNAEAISLRPGPMNGRRHVQNFGIVFECRMVRGTSSNCDHEGAQRMGGRSVTPSHARYSHRTQRRVVAAVGPFLEGWRRAALAPSPACMAAR